MADNDDQEAKKNLNVEPGAAIAAREQQAATQHADNMLTSQLNAEDQRVMDDKADYQKSEHAKELAVEHQAQLEARQARDEKQVKRPQNLGEDIQTAKLSIIQVVDEIPLIDWLALGFKNLFGSVPRAKIQSSAEKALENYYQEKGLSETLEAYKSQILAAGSDDVPAESRGISTDSATQNATDATTAPSTSTTLLELHGLGVNDGGVQIIQLSRFNQRINRINQQLRARNLEAVSPSEFLYDLQVILANDLQSLYPELGLGVPDESDRQINIASLSADWHSVIVQTPFAAVVATPEREPGLAEFHGQQQSPDNVTDARGASHETRASLDQEISSVLNPQPGPGAGDLTKEKDDDVSPDYS